MILEPLKRRKIELDKQFQGGSIREKAVLKMSVKEVYLNIIKNDPFMFVQEHSN